MREILFRGKRVDNGEWISGDLITTPFIRNETQQNIIYILDITKADYDCFEDLTEDNGIFEVDPETVCQYTGSTDKNGRKIFEGDIVKVLYTNGQEDGGDVTEVKCSEKSASFSPWDWEYDCDGCDLYFHIKEIEIVGNAFDKE